MIPFDFIYCQPNTLSEAADTYAQLQSEGKTPVYYAGGSEIITMCRAGAIQPGAVIDIKHIPACTLLEANEQALHIGSACTLYTIKESSRFPLLRLACGRIADHTNQCRITLGGNLCGSIIYRETSLPLLIADADITLYNREGARTLPFQSIFDGRMQLRPGELIVQAHIPSWALTARHAHVKRTKNEKIDYPLLSMAAIWKDNFLRIAFTGICEHPFRSEEIEAILNERHISRAARAERASKCLPAHVPSNVEGSGAYKLFVLQHTLEELLEEWENGQI